MNEIESNIIHREKAMNKISQLVGEKDIENMMKKNKERSTSLFCRSSEGE